MWSEIIEAVINVTISQRCVLQGMWVKGIVDELRLDDLGKIIVVEHKSRKNHSLPSEAQKDTARLQVRL